METYHVDFSKSLSTTEKEVLNRLIQQEMEEKGQSLLLRDRQYIIQDTTAVTLSQQILKRTSNTSKVEHPVANRYQVLGILLGAGTYGRVFDSPTFRLEGKSVKMSEKPRIVKEQKWNGAGKKHQLAKDEAKITSTVYRTKVKNVVFFSHSDREHLSYTCMKKFSGESLKEALSHKIKLDWNQQKELCQNLANALSKIHMHIVHRDIKPDNIMYDPSTNTASIIDFGLSKMKNEPDLATSTPPGTALYRAPEACRNQSSTKSDIYSFGPVLAEVLGASQKQLFSKKRAYYPINPLFAKTSYDFSDIKVPEELKDSVIVMLERMTDNNPDQRPMAEDIAAYFANLSLAKKRSESPSMTEPGSYRP